MSGGSYGYAYRRVEEFAEALEAGVMFDGRPADGAGCIARLGFAAHLRGNYPEIPDSSNRRLQAGRTRGRQLQPRCHPVGRLSGPLGARHPVPPLGHHRPARIPGQGIRHG